MNKLNRTEKNEIVKLSNEFVEIHKEIVQVEKNIQKMQQRTKILVEKLEECRDREKKFTQKLQTKYGEGYLDPMNLEWKNEIEIYETQS